MTGPALLAEYFSVHFSAIVADLIAMFTHPAFFGVCTLFLLSFLVPIAFCALGCLCPLDYEPVFLILAVVSFFGFLALSIHFSIWCEV